MHYDFIEITPRFCGLSESFNAPYAMLIAPAAHFYMLCANFACDAVNFG